MFYRFIVPVLLFMTSKLAFGIFPPENNEVVLQWQVLIHFRRDIYLHFLSRCVVFQFRRNRMFLPRLQESSTRKACTRVLICIFFTSDM